jgi:tetratricopeptide (TPR) repeat protein
LFALVVGSDAAGEHTAKGIHLLEIFDFYGAEREFNEVLKLVPDSEVAMVNLALAHYYQGQFVDARKVLERAHRKSSEDPYILFLLGVVAKVSENPEAASSLFRSVIQIDPDEFSPYYQLGLIESKEGRPDRAVGFFEQALKLNPDCTAATYNLGRALIQSGHPEEGQKKLSEFQELRKRIKKPVRGGMGEPAILQGKYAQARTLP